MHLRRVLALLAVLLVTAACTPTPTDESEGSPTMGLPRGSAPGPGAAGQGPAPGPTSGPCEPLREHLLEHTRGHVEARGLNTVVIDGVRGYHPEIPPSELPHLDGLVITTSRDGLQHLVDITENDPRMLTALDPRLRIDGAYRQGDRLLLLSQGWNPDRENQLHLVPPKQHEARESHEQRGWANTEERAWYWDPRLHLPYTTLTLLDLSEPTEPRTLSTLQLDGSLVAALPSSMPTAESPSTEIEAPEALLHLVTRSVPTVIPYADPEPHYDGGTPPDAEDQYLAMLEAASIDDWLPDYSFTDGSGDLTTGELLNCSSGAVAIPTAFDGIGVLTVTTLDLTTDLRPVAAVGVLGRGARVHTGAGLLAVTATDWPAGEDALSASTGIQLFDLADPRSPVHLAAGIIPGQLTGTDPMELTRNPPLDRALDEPTDAPGSTPSSAPLEPADARLRIVTALGLPDLAAVQPRAPAAASTAVTVLELRDGSLEPAEALDDLAPAEGTREVHWLDDTLLISTQPGRHAPRRDAGTLHTLDVSGTPRTTGTLELDAAPVTMHPLAGGRVLAVGPRFDADRRFTGSEVMLLDTSDTSSPVLTDSLVLERASVDLALLDEATGLAVLPYSISFWVEEEQREIADTGVLLLRVTGASLAEVARISYLDPAYVPRDEAWARHFGAARIWDARLVEDRLVLSSGLGIGTHDPDTGEQLGWLELADR